MPPHDRLDLARVLLARAVDDETLVRKVSRIRTSPTRSSASTLSYLVGVVEENEIEAPEALSEADVLSPWAVEFRYEGEEPPALDRSAALALVEQVRAWTENEIKAADHQPQPEQQQQQ